MTNQPKMPDIEKEAKEFARELSEPNARFWRNGSEYTIYIDYGGSQDFCWNKKFSEDSVLLAIKNGWVIVTSRTGKDDYYIDGIVSANPITYVRSDTITPPAIVEEMAEALRLCADLLDDSITDGHYQEVAKALAAYEESRKCRI